MMFVVVFSKEDKKKLEDKGYKYICTRHNGEKESYVFADNVKLTFSKDVKVLRTNKMYF